jgi:hypothetical protein
MWAEEWSGFFYQSIWGKAKKTSKNYPLPYLFSIGKKNLSWDRYYIYCGRMSHWNTDSGLQVDRRQGFGSSGSVGEVKTGLLILIVPTLLASRAAGLPRIYRYMGPDRYIQPACCCSERLDEAGNSEKNVRFNRNQFPIFFFQGYAPPTSWALQWVSSARDTRKVSIHKKTRKYLSSAVIMEKGKKKIAQI